MSSLATKIHNTKQLDCIYNSYWLNQWLQLLLVQGKKETAENYTIKCLKYFKLQFGIYPYFVFNNFFFKYNCGVEVRSYRKSNVFYDVPFPVKILRQYKQNIHWVLMAIRSQRKISFKNTLLSEIIQFLRGKTNLLTKHQMDLLQTLVKSRVYQQYRW
jgi:ribosomal protein S7